MWHRANHIWILNSKGELLLQQRAKEKINYGGFWDVSAAGHISAGETATKSALREIEEELGIKVIEKELILLGIITQQIILDDGKYIDNEYDNIYIIKKDIDISEMKKQENEVQDLKYIHWTKLKRWIHNEKFFPHPEEEYELLFNYLEGKFK